MYGSLKNENPEENTRKISKNSEKEAILSILQNLSIFH